MLLFFSTIHTRSFASLSFRRTTRPGRGRGRVAFSSRIPNEAVPLRASLPLRAEPHTLGRTPLALLCRRPRREASAPLHPPPSHTQTHHSPCFCCSYRSSSAPAASECRCFTFPLFEAKFALFVLVTFHFFLYDFFFAELNMFVFLCCYGKYPVLV